MSKKKSSAKVYKIGNKTVYLHSCVKPKNEPDREDYKVVIYCSQMEGSVTFETSQSNIDKLLKALAA